MHTHSVFCYWVNVATTIQCKYICTNNDSVLQSAQQLIYVFNPLANTIVTLLLLLFCSSHSYFYIITYHSCIILRTLSRCQWQDEAPQRRPAGGLHLLCLSSPSWCLWKQWPPTYPQLDQNPGTFPDPQDHHSPQTLPVCGHLQRETRYDSVLPLCKGSNHIVYPVFPFYCISSLVSDVLFLMFILTEFIQNSNQGRTCCHSWIFVDSGDSSLVSFCYFVWNTFAVVYMQVRC